MFKVYAVDDLSLEVVDLLEDQLMGHSRNWRLTCGENWKNDSERCAGQGASEVFGKVLCPAEEVGLEQGCDSPAGKGLSSGGENGGDFGWMVGVIVDNGYSTVLANKFETSPHTAEIGEALGEDFEIQTQFHGGSKSGQGVADVVVSWKVQPYFTKDLSALIDGEGGRQAVDFDSSGPEVVARAEAVGYDRGVGASRKRGRAGVVAADEDRAVEWGACGKSGKGGVQRLFGFVAIEVILFNVGDDGNERIEFQERLVKFVSLTDCKVACTSPAISVDPSNKSADDGGWPCACPVENVAQESARRCFSVCSRDGD